MRWRSRIDYGVQYHCKTSKGLVAQLSGIGIIEPKLDLGILRGFFRSGYKIIVLAFSLFNGLTRTSHCVLERQAVRLSAAYDAVLLRTDIFQDLLLSLCQV